MSHCIKIVGESIKGAVNNTHLEDCTIEKNAVLNKCWLVGCTVDDGVVMNNCTTDGCRFLGGVNMNNCNNTINFTSSVPGPMVSGFPASHGVAFVPLMVPMTTDPTAASRMPLVAANPVETLPETCSRCRPGWNPKAMGGHWH